MEQKRHDTEKWAKAIDRTVSRLDEWMKNRPPCPNEDAILYRSLEKVLIRIDRQRNLKRRRLYGITAVAAILTGIFFTTLHLTDDTTVNYREITTRYGEKCIVALPDGSRVWLNAGSRLSYPEQFQGKERKVKIEGEAFFEISENPDRPFIASSNRMQIEVLGTTFNVHDYTEDHTATVSLETGKIKLRLPDNPGYETCLVPGKTAIYIPGKQFCEIIDSEEYTGGSGWKEGELNFFNTSIKEVIKTLERKYNISVSLTDTAVENYSYTFHSKQEEPAAIFKRMERITPIRIRQTSDGHYHINQK